MKARLLILRSRIDALTLRERAMLFAAAAAVIVFVAVWFVLNPMYARQDALRLQLRQQQGLIAGVDAEITQKVLAHAQDPDAPLAARIATVRADSAKQAAHLRDMGSSLVAPENMAPLLESLLKVNGKLKLESLVTMAPPASADSKAAAPMFYRHGVQLTVSGSYAVMVAYMDALEAMPTRLFWGSAALDADAWPQARLTLTVYTLSLDPTWMSL